MPRQSSDHIDGPAALGERLRSARLAARLTQGDLAFAGCSIGYISRIESGARTPSLQVIRRLAERLGVEEHWLARGEAPEPEPATLLREASLALRLDETDEAERLFSEVGAAFPTPRIQALALAGLGQTAFRRGDAPAAIAQLEEALRIDPELDDPAAAETLGRAYARLDAADAAIALFRRWLRRAETAGDASMRFRFAVLLADALIDDGSFGEAAELLADVLPESELGDPLALSRAFWAQARLFGTTNDRERAQRAATRALELVEATEHSYYRARAHQLLAFAELEARNGEQALALLETGLVMLGASATPDDVAELQLEQARALAVTGDADGAFALATDAREMLSLDDHTFDLARCDLELADAFDATGRPERARELFERAIELLDRTAGPSRHHVDAYTRFAAHLERHGETERALQLYKRAAAAGQRGRRYVPELAT